MVSPQLGTGLQPCRRPSLASFLGYPARLLRAVSPLPCAAAATWTYRIAGWPALRGLIDADEAVVGGMYHGRQLGLWGYISKPQCRQWSVMVSRSQDGNFMSALLEALGWKTIRGSSGRGGAAALKGAALGMKNGDTTRLCLAVDGSRARFMCQIGALSLSSLSGSWFIAPRPAPIARIFYIVLGIKPDPHALGADFDGRNAADSHSAEHWNRRP